MDRSYQVWFWFTISYRKPIRTIVIYMFSSKHSANNPAHPVFYGLLALTSSLKFRTSNVCPTVTGPAAIDLSCSPESSLAKGAGLNVGDRNPHHFLVPQEKGSTYSVAPFQLHKTNTCLYIIAPPRCCFMWLQQLQVLVVHASLTTASLLYSFVRLLDWPRKSESWASVVVLCHVHIQWQPDLVVQTKKARTHPDMEIILCHVSTACLATSTK